VEWKIGKLFRELKRRPPKGRATTRPAKKNAEEKLWTKVPKGGKGHETVAD